MASDQELVGDENPGAQYRVPLEPYPAPPFQAIDQQGYEYPPRCVRACVGRDVVSGWTE